MVLRIWTRRIHFEEFLPPIFPYIPPLCTRSPLCQILSLIEFAELQCHPNTWHTKCVSFSCDKVTWLGLPLEYKNFLIINRPFSPVFSQPFEYRTIWKLDRSVPFEYRTCALFRWLLYLPIKSKIYLPNFENIIFSGWPF